MEIFCLLFRRYLPKNNQRRREKTPVGESRSSHISGTDVLTLKAKERLIERCRNRGKTTSVESCNRHTYTKHSHPLTYTHNCRTLTPRKKTKPEPTMFFFLYQFIAQVGERQEDDDEETELLTGELKKKTQKKS